MIGLDLVERRDIRYKIDILYLMGDLGYFLWVILIMYVYGFFLCIVLKVKKFLKNSILE